MPIPDANVIGGNGRMFGRKAHALGPGAGQWSDGFYPHGQASQGPGWAPGQSSCSGWGPGCGGWGPVGSFDWVGPNFPDHVQPPGLVSGLAGGSGNVPPGLTGYPVDIDLWFSDQLIDSDATLRVSTTTVAQTFGHFSDGTIFEWSCSSGVLSGSGQRVNWTPDTVGTATVEVCADRPTGPTRCLAKEFEVAAAPARVSIEGVETVLDLGFGRFASVTGHIVGAAPGTVELAMFKHTDVHYLDDAPITLESDGTFSVLAFLFDNVSRINVVAKAPGVELSTFPGCNAHWCWGDEDPASGRHLPVLPDQVEVSDVDIHYLRVSTHPDPAVAALDDRRASIPVLGTADSYLYRASAESEQYYLYDQATVAIGLVAAGEYARAAALLDGLQAAQLSDGSWPFLMWDNGDPYWWDGDIRYTGANSWAVMAFNAYHIATGTTTYSAVVIDALDYLDSLRHADGARMPLRFNPSDLPSTTWDERDVNSFEHNADALSAFAGHAQVLGYESHPGTIADLEGWIGDRWNGTYFNPGTHTIFGDNARERYLDTQTWGLLALGGVDTMYHDGLRNDCSVFFDVAGHVRGLTGLLGFSDFAWSTGELPYGPFIWSEGTLGYIAALDEVERATGTTVMCEGFGSDDLYDTMSQMLLDAELPTSTSNAHPEYTEVPGTAALGWWLMVDAGLNPFRPWDAL